MIIKAKLRKVGNSLGILIPKEVITFIEDSWEVNELVEGDEVYFQVITDESNYLNLPCGVITETVKADVNVITKEEKVQDVTENVITKKKPTGSMELCKKHDGSMKITCGCL